MGTCLRRQQLPCCPGAEAAKCHEHPTSLTFSGTYSKSSRSSPFLCPPVTTSLLTQHALICQALAPTPAPCYLHVNSPVLANQPESQSFYKPNSPQNCPPEPRMPRVGKSSADGQGCLIHHTSSSTKTIFFPQVCCEFKSEMFLDLHRSQSRGFPRSCGVCLSRSH